jgi:hypothetical protein
MIMYGRFAVGCTVFCVVVFALAVWALVVIGPVGGGDPMWGLVAFFFSFAAGITAVVSGVCAVGMVVKLAIFHFSFKQRNAPVASANADADTAVMLEEGGGGVAASSDSSGTLYRLS